VTPATKKLLEEFDALPDQDRSAFVAELARRIALARHDLPHNDDPIRSIRFSTVSPNGRL
jgi:hypothetical protein